MNTTQTTITPTETDRARDAGYGAGHNAGSWVLDGNSSELDAHRILTGYDEGWPEIMDICPSPLSGEWAGESIPELSATHGVDLMDPDLADIFESAFTDGFWDEVTRSARYAITGEA